LVWSLVEANDEGSIRILIVMVVVRSNDEHQGEFVVAERVE
jgi:hypothetical protein